MKTNNNQVTFTKPFKITTIFLLCFMCIVKNVQAGPKQTTILQHAIVTDVDELLIAQGHQNSRDLELKIPHSIPKQEKMWIIVNYTAELSDIGQKGETILGILPEGIPAKSGSWGLIFKSNKMRPVEKSIQHFLTTDSRPIQFQPDKENVLNHHYRKVPVSTSDIYNYEERLNQLVKNSSNKKILQQAALINYEYDQDIWQYQGGSFNISVDLADNMKPLSIELIFGEGKIPDDLQLALNNNHWYSKPLVKRIFFLTIFFIAINYLRSKKSD